MNMDDTKEQVKEPPLILLFSSRERVRGILMAGLLQQGYRMLDAETPYVAAIKAAQFLPDLVIADIHPGNVKDLLFVDRLQRSMRTSSITILLIIPNEVNKMLEDIRKASDQDNAGGGLGIVHTLDYPFHFADLLKKIEGILVHRKVDAEEEIEGQPKMEMVAENLFDLETPAQSKLRRVERSVQKQWAFPFTVVKALDIVGTSSSSCQELAKCIETDVAVTSAILRVANTVFYAKRGGRISDINEAVVRIGFDETRRLLGCLGLIDLSSDLYEGFGFTRRDFWMHSLSTAIIAEKLCQDCGYRRPELAFVSGLIHDLGKVPMDNNFSRAFLRLLKETTTRVSAFHETERSMMGFTHAGLGHYLTNQWNFPSAITLAILHHHDPSAILSTKNPMDRVLRESVYVANIFSKAVGLGHSCDRVFEQIPTKILKEIKLPRGPKRYFFETVFRDVKNFADYLELPKDEVHITPSGTVVKDVDVIVVYGDKMDYHPVVTALDQYGFRPWATKSVPEPLAGKNKIVIYILDQETPLDFVIKEEQEAKQDKDTHLRIFLLDGLDPEESRKEFTKSNILLLDRNRLDLRLVLHSFDEYLGRVVVPTKKPLSELEQTSQDS